MSLPGLVVLAGRAIGTDPEHVGAEALAVRAGTIVAIGSRADVARLVHREDRVLELPQGTVAPGFIDAHLHLRAMAGRRSSIACGPDQASSIPDLLALLRRRAEALPPGAWVRAHGYDEFYLAERRHPRRAELDSAVPDHPARLRHRTGAASLLNSRGLEMLQRRSLPPAARIEIDPADGQPSGLVHGIEDFLTREVVGPLGAREMERGLRATGAELAAQGITCVHDLTAHNRLADVSELSAARAAGHFRQRLRFYVDPRDGGALGWSGGEAVRVVGAKVVVREDGPGVRPDARELRAALEPVAGRGLAAAVHAVEPAEILTALAALEALPPPRRGRHRIEHGGCCPPPLVARAGQARVAVVVQPSFVLYFGDRYLAETDPAAHGWLHRLRSWREAGVEVVGSSDAPVSPAAPLTAISAARSRCTRGGRPVAVHEALDQRAALDLFWRAAAAVAGDWPALGRLGIGAAADLVVLGADPLQERAEATAQIPVLATVVAGEVVHEAA